jgi:NADH-quinone oxidoreductase subunit C
MKEILLDLLNRRFAGQKFEVSEFREELTITVNPSLIVDICRFLKEDPELQFVQCVDVTAVDNAERKNRFTTVYNLYSFHNNFRLRVKANVPDEDYTIDSVAHVWKSANWYEREAYDMYGIIFRNHPDLRRMYMPEEFEHHPLRKDFPLLGIPGSLPLPQK